MKSTAMPLRVIFAIWMTTLIANANPMVDTNTPAGALPVSGGTAWQLDFSDEFSGSSLNTNKWGVDVSASSRAARTDRGISDWWWKSQNVSLDGAGNLKLDVVKFDSNTMHCGSVSSDGKYEPMYGYLEARIKIADTTKDTHTAFWLQGPNMNNSDPADGTANDGAEVDIFESAWFGDYTKAVVHYDGYDADHKADTKQYATPGLHSGYHVFGLEWTASSMKIYYDGVLKVTYSGIKVPQVNEWLWLSCGASFGDIGTFQTEPNGLLTSAYVDYVRVWKALPTYSVTYNGNGSSGGNVPTDSSVYASGATVTVLGNTGNLTKPGYSFAGWNTAANGSGTGYATGNTYTISSNSTLYAMWTPVTSTVTFDGNGGGTPSPSSKSVTYAETYGTLATTSRTGYTFSGWYTAASGGSLVGSSTTVTNASDHTLYARWTVITYAVTYNDNGSSGGSVPVDSNEYEQGASVTVLGNINGLTKPNCNFAGWNTAANGSGTSYTPASSFVIGAGNIQLYALWTSNNAPVVDAGAGQTVYVSGSTLWNPASISTAAWYDASDANSLWADTLATSPATTVVARWNDKSGNNHHLAQATSTKQPSTGVSTYNGKNVLTFTPSPAQNLFTTNTLTWDNVYIVCDNPDMSYGSRPTAVGGNTTTIYTVQFNNNVVDAAPDAWVGSGYYVNGIPTAATAADAALVANPTLIRRSSTTTSDISIGSDRQLSNRSWNGRIAEVIFLNGASSENRQKVEGYLAYKWGLATLLPVGHPYEESAPSNPAAVITLNGIVSDADGQSPTTTWSKQSGPGVVTFVDASAQDTSATFTQVGTYILRLTANDGVNSSYGEVTIIVSAATPYSTWAGGSYAQTFTDTGFTANPDGDSLNNLQEFAFGSDPTSSRMAPTIFVEGGELTQPGLPVSHFNGSSPLAIFTRRKDYLTAGLIYDVDFSADLILWTTSTATPELRTSAAAAGDYEAVSVPYPETVPVDAGGAEQTPRFFRLGVR